MCLGESTTALGGGNSYPRHLERILNEGNPGIRFSVINKGIAATNTTMISTLLEDNLVRYQPDLVLTMIGINDGEPNRAIVDTSPEPMRRFLRNIRVYKLAQLLYDHAKLTFAPESSPISPAGNSESPDEALEATEKVGFPEQRAFLENNIRENPNDPHPYLELSDLLMDRGALAEAEQYLQKTEKLAPELLANRYQRLTRMYFDQGLLTECIRVGEKALAASGGRNPTTGDFLARAYLAFGKAPEAERVCRLVLQSHPHFAPAWCYLGDALRGRKWEKAEEAYLKAVELEPLNIAYTHLMREYIKRREFDKAEELGLNIIARKPEATRILGLLAHLYQTWAKHELDSFISKDTQKSSDLDHVREKKELADYYHTESAIRQGQVYQILTIENYRKIADILQKRGVRLGCVQYPMRSIDPLKIILAGKPGVIFVDNGEIFREAVSQNGFDYYFTDCFGGDFGHCTPAGNNLLARNIADTILRELFKTSGER
ncbi:MAG: GDSL-type esterase/lipase family protein [Candidatus Erginobacter occultus]|nr:GDSL-type esterase/lipase family protein [Candidatus Erginobacter occultus]